MMNVILFDKRKGFFRVIENITYIDLSGKDIKLVEKSSEEYILKKYRWSIYKVMEWGV